MVNFTPWSVRPEILYAASDYPRPSIKAPLSPSFTMASCTYNFPNSRPRQQRAMIEEIGVLNSELASSRMAQERLPKDDRAAPNTKLFKKTEEVTAMTENTLATNFARLSARR